MANKSYSYHLTLAANQNIKERDYWLKNLGDKPVKTGFFTDFPAREIPRKTHEVFPFTIPEALAMRLINVSSKSDYTLHIVLVSGLALLLHHYTGSQDILIGSPIYRQKEETDFINRVVVIRARIEPSMTFKDLLLRMKDTVLQAVEHQNYPFPVLVDKLGYARTGQDPDNNPLFDTALVLDNLHEKSYLQEEDYNMLFSFLRVDEKVSGQIAYAPHLYHPSSIERLALHLGLLFDRVLADINQPVGEIDFLSEAEREKIERQFNQPGTSTAASEPVIASFMNQASKNPDAIALISYGQTGGPYLVSMSYGELAGRIRHLARYLAEKGAGANTIVAVILPPGPEIVIALLGILAAGCAYLPIDPGAPAERRDYILADSGAEILLSAPLPDFPQNKLENLGGHEMTGRGELIFAPTDLAYVIYTSGTTGKPKGVLVDQQNLQNYLNAFFKEFDIGAKDVVINLSDYTFDAFVEEMYPVLLRGGRLVIPGVDEYLDMGKLGRFISRQSVTMIDCSPLLLNQLNRLAGPNELRIVISGGDMLRPAYVDRFMKNQKIALYNTYGPTESTVCATYYRYKETPEIGAGIPIGRPIANYRVFIMNRRLCLNPIGVAGEICITGPGVTRGYLNNPELTAEKFTHPSTTHQSPLTNRLYKTGDLGRWLPDGNIEYLGRIDQQVKIRGFRIEIGEIETLLSKQPGIKEAAVIARLDKEGEKYLCAYYATTPGKDLQPETSGPDPAGLIAYLQKKLPDYMIPAFFVKLEKLPLTPAGKLDKQALPEPQVKSSVEYVAPQDDIEKRLHQIWLEVFDLERIGIDDNFFEIGGHSLKAAVMISRINQVFQVSLPLGEVFRTPSIRQLAVFIQSAGASIRASDASEDENLVLLKAGNTGDANLFLVHDGVGAVEGYVELCNRFASPVNCWGIRPARFENYHDAPQAIRIEDLAQKYLEKINRFQSHGPYHIAGWSIGGTIAFEIVRLLEAQQETIASFSLIDVVGPHVDLVKYALDLNLKSESDFLKNHLPAIAGDTDFTGATDLGQLWSATRRYLEKNPPATQVFRKIAAELEAYHLAENEQGIGDLIKYMNMGRTLHNARVFYVPAGKIASPVHFFLASKSSHLIEKQAWENFCQAPILFEEIPGDHFSLLRQPAVNILAARFDEILSKKG